MVSIRHGGEGSVERQNLQSVAREIEVADDFGSQQRDHIRANGKLEAGKNFLGASRAAEKVPALEHKHFLSRLREIGGVGEAVVASANHDYVILSTA